LLNFKMSVNRLKHGSNLRLVLLVLWLVCYVSYGQFEDTNDFNNPAVLPLVTQMVYRSLSNSTAALNQELATRAKFCVKDPDADWNKAFNFSTNLDFLSSCIQKTKGDIGRRMCTAAEMKFYLNAFFSKTNNPGYLQPNGNCNLTSWVSGCEPGWACSVDPNEQVDLQNSKDFPERTRNCMSCCEGFFCPRGLTCMIPCPLGAHCPLATLNKTTSLCQPYTYQLPPGQPNHTCGGANVWADIRSSGEVFCSAGSYCPTTTRKVPCDSGHYCRMGSTSEKPCFKLTSCNPNTANQNMHALGVMVICGVVTILLIIYNCSDQILTTRERRQAKSREAAVKKAKANQRWKVARTAATKHVTEIRAQITRTFSGKKPNNDGETHKMLARGYSSEVEDLPKYSSSPASSSAVQPTFEIEDDATAGSIERPSATTTGGKRGKGHRIKKSQSQILRYAYNQIEKEKAREVENRNLTFSGIVNMATYSEMKKRTLMELSFKDLTLTLKSNGKHLLRCVTGSMKPGRITAVMGPSGAGKTSLLSALAGKAVGCKLSGLILINGKELSIHSYKKIIGFVPQDDIVHGNLTVEENIWFHANCRLPAGQSKADKVLVVERVIDSLGLQAVRSSLVGTVEKRGISGGQRKRVNVGLEMAMEPSILFLDEPTSGLDTSDESFGAPGYTYTIIAVSLLCKIAALRSFSLDKLHYWRESASGMSSLACFLAKDTMDCFNTLVKPLVYLSMFYFFTNPRSTFFDNYIVLVCLVYCVTGIAYALAIFLQPGSAQLFSVLLPVVLTLVATQPKDSEAMKIIADLCYPKWALQAFVIGNAQKYYGVWMITRCGSLMKSGYDINEWNLCIMILILIGGVTRMIAFVGMIILQKR
ncbi:hypothetical protein BRARA_F00123, partial [Brassica rapa]